MNNKNIARHLLLLIFFLFTLAVPQAMANITGAHYLFNSMNQYVCAPLRFDATWAASAVYQLTSGGGVCAISDSGYVPSGYYKVRSEVIGDSSAGGSPAKDGQVLLSADSSSVYISEKTPINQQNLTVSGSTTAQVDLLNQGSAFCQFLVDESGNKYLLGGGNALILACGQGETPVPPNPPRPNTSCKINNGNVIDVDLGTLERSTLPTVVAKTEQTVVYPFNVDCTGGISIGLKMQLKYDTTISVNGKRVIKSSANGLGVGVFFTGAGYTDTIVQSSTVINLTIPATGQSNFSLGFQPIRDPKVAAGNIPTGDFTASATLVMTEQ